MKTKILAVIALAITMAACEKDPIENNNQSSIPFMKVGNKWTYEWYAEGAQASITFFYEITSIDEDGFAEIICTNSVNDYHAEHRWFANDEFFADESGAFPNELFPLYYKNGTVGKKWDAPEVDDELGLLTRKIVALSETVTIDEITYRNCIKVKQTYELDLNVVDYYWINETVGIIKKEQTGWLDLNDEPRKYFGVTTTLKNINF